MTTYRPASCLVRWLVMLTAFWLAVALWSPGAHALAAESVPVTSSVHVGEDPGSAEPGLRCQARSPAKRPRATGGPPPAVLVGGSPAHLVRATHGMVEEAPAQEVRHTRRLVRLSVWRV
ncbi:hypothetical protein FXF51_17195 [Nonomuraea sp. PA05]|uniref:hypothetical protein n=1 Tax=Nonomuraea sp. PA05 TaxID=2604466 RepID=UPI0011D2EE17|nr:hypothetical protein [Nonomuraea sp. PA05]TYB66821.1 hypothetical protein FXF51_17195 [Nonomuraea sp. PA05]